MEHVEGRIAITGFNLRYVVAGSGPTMVWLHGAGGMYVTAGTDLLAERFRMIMVELPGFGDSAAHDAARTFDELSEQVAEGLTALGLQKCLLHGTSFGGATALHLALNHPELVERLILESPAAFRPEGWIPPDLETVRSGLFLHPERVRRVQVDPERAQRERELVNRMSLTVDRDALAARVRAAGALMVMFGDSDALTPPALAAMYCDNAPDCTSVVIEDAGHVVSSDQPEAYVRAVAEFALREFA